MTTTKRHWPDCAVNHGGDACDMGSECGMGLPATQHDSKTVLLADPTKKVLRFRPGALELVCPFCGQTAIAGLVHDPEGIHFEDGAPVACHVQPECQTFIDLEPDEYLARVRRALAAAPRA